MSRIVTLRGIVTNDLPEKILLFGAQQDNFSKAYRILDFKIFPNDPQASVEISAKITTIAELHSNAWNWAKNTEVAWAAYGVPISTRFGIFSNVDDEALIVEDIYIDVAGVADGRTNYEIKLEQVDVKDFQAALSMVNNRAQGSD